MKTPKKWVNPNLKKRIISKKKFTKLTNKKNSILFETRYLNNQVKSHIKKYVNIDPIQLRDYILVQDTKDIIIIISQFERTYVKDVTWALTQNYKKIFIYYASEDNLDWIVKKA